jgi:hypothetical protein
MTTTRTRTTKPALQYLIGQHATTTAGPFTIDVTILAAYLISGILYYQVTPKAGTGIAQIQAARITLMEPQP